MFRTCRTFISRIMEIPLPQTPQIRRKRSNTNQLCPDLRQEFKREPDNFVVNRADLAYRYDYKCIDSMFPIRINNNNSNNDINHFVCTNFSIKSCYIYQIVIKIQYLTKTTLQLVESYTIYM